jgi:transposase-like protein
LDCSLLSTARGRRRAVPPAAAGTATATAATGSSSATVARGCRRTFNPLSGTPLARLRHRRKWLDYLGSMLDSRTVRAAADQVGVHRNTSFRWRHRFLHRAKHDQPDSLTGIAEVDEMFLLESQKGSRTLRRPPRRRGGVAKRRGFSREHVCILVARDRSGTVDSITGRGKVTVAQLHRHLLPALDRDVLLVTDAHPAYRTFARQAGFSHKAVNVSAGKRVRGAVHVQNVNAHHRRFRQWLARFNRFASKYLPNYLGWPPRRNRRAVATRGAGRLQPGQPTLNGDSALFSVESCAWQASIIGRLCNLFKRI